MTIEQILAMEDSQSAIIELDTIINELCDYGEQLDKLNEAQKIVLFVENLEREVNNGGFNQFYSNSSGDYSHETLAALKTIGANKMAKIMETANAQWPNGKILSDSDDRYDIQETIEENANPIWEECDELFYKYPDDISSLLIKYVKENKEQFK